MSGIREKYDTSGPRGTAAFEGPRIAVTLAQLRGAGIQRMRLNIIRRLLDSGYAVDLVVGSGSGPLADSIPDSVPLYTVAGRGSWSFFFGLLNYLRKRRPTHVLSSYEDISVMLIVANWLLGSRFKVLLSTHNALTKLPQEGGRLNSLKHRLLFPLMRWLYPRATSLVAVSEGVASEVSAVVGVPVEDIRVIYNPVIDGHFHALSREDAPPDISALSDEPLIGFFGRFHPQKRVDTLIRAFAQVRKSRPCRLILLGEGEQQQEFQQLAAELGVASDVIFRGFVQNPFPVMKCCDVTVLSSAYEGLGNVLVESLACGTQVVSTDCPHGPAEILENGRWGQLVPVGDIAALGEAIRKSLDREFWVEPARLKERGMQFSAIHATDQYLAALGLPATVSRGG